ncbi:MAG TPA: hypothetical protein VE988_17985, partial [Gemmataceae bacterium]|nr:hypothetical protein [Gemmataceae bacterium]
MLKNRWIRMLATAVGSLALALASTSVGQAQVNLGQPSCGQPECNTCNTCQSCEPSCNIWNCPPSYTYCQEGPPRIHIVCGCPKPVCCPIDAPNWGYFATCWRPSPWSPTMAHCYGTTAATPAPAPVQPHAAYQSPS